MKASSLVLGVTIALGSEEIVEHYVIMGPDSMTASLKHT